MNNTQRVSLDTLPTEIIYYICQFLSYEDLISLQKTCKTCSNVLYDSATDNLYEYQKPHYFRIKDALNKYGYAVDTSIMGSGKTYTTCAIAKRLKISITVFCPKSVIGVWYDVSKQYDISDIVVYTYAKLRGKNEYLDSNLIPTDKWFQRLNQGTLLIYDECQNLKNKTKQFKSALSLAKTMGTNSASKMILLSATPVDKDEQVSRYCKMLGIIKRDKLAYQDIQRGYVRDGINDLFDYCKLPPQERFMYELNFNKFTKNIIVKKLFIKYIKPYSFFAMKPPPIEYPIDIKNGFYNISEDARELLQRGMNTLAASLNPSNVQDGLNGVISQHHQINWGGISKGLSMINRAKVEIIVRITKIEMNKPNVKVVCMMNFLESIDLCTEALKEYGSLKMIGEMNIKRRNKILHDFNYDPKYRVLIANTRIASLGISLHDTIGNSPRVMFIIPTYAVMDMHQATRRIYRQGSKSSAVVRFIYGNQQNENRILTSLARKCNIMREFSDEKLKDIKYPSEYEPYYELTDYEET